ncbi:hypothetical protein Tco_1361391 [Tanacetum coccineum]
MAVLESCPKHNMVAYLEKTDGNTEFHEVISFLTRSSIHYALTVSPVVSTTFVEQFWMSAKSKLINNVRYITAKVAGKPVSISEASIRSDLLFNDADGIDSLPNQAIFDAIQLMGYEGDLTVLTFNKALFSPQWRFLFHTMNHCISSKSTSWDQIPTNIATAVICLTTNQKYNFSKLVFDGMMRHLDAKKKFVMYPRFISVFLDKQLKNVPVPLDHLINALSNKNNLYQTFTSSHFSDSIPEGYGGKPWRSSHSVDRSLSGLDEECIHEAKTGRKEILKEIVDANGVSFDELDDDGIDYMETEDAQDVGRTRYVMHEEKERAEKEFSIEDALNTAQPKVSTDKEEVSTDRPDEGTAQTKLKQYLEMMKNYCSSSYQNEQQSSFKRIGERELYLNDMGKKKIEKMESDTESGRPSMNSEKSLRCLPMMRRLQERCKRIGSRSRKEKFSCMKESLQYAALLQDFDDIKARN